MNCSHNYSICKCWPERSVCKCVCECVYACICINVCWALVGCNWACSTGHIVTFVAFVTWAAADIAAAADAAASLWRKSQFWQDALMCCSIKDWLYLYSTQYENTTTLMCSYFKQEGQLGLYNGLGCWCCYFCYWLRAAVQHWYYCLHWAVPLFVKKQLYCMNNVWSWAAWGALLLLTIQTCFTLVREDAHKAQHHSA